MMPEEMDLVQAVAAATGDDGVVAAGRFRPVGFLGNYFVGFLVGNAIGSAALGGGSGVVGGALDDVGSIGGAALGAEAGLARAAEKGGGLEFLVGVSPTHVHVTAPLAIGDDDTAYRVVHSFDRSKLEVSVKARVTNRRLVLTDVEDETHIELEGVRLPGNHVSEVVHALVIDGHGGNGE